uniref:Uncharacterized protein n=1 Tax=Ralstonia solanacearum TaxID=305 RepID=A0A0S4UF27_RALSL|nr:protein of unknown function [Ralstonia solanacearum]
MNRALRTCGWRTTGCASTNVPRARRYQIWEERLQKCSKYLTTSFLISIRQAIPIVLARCHGVYVIIMDMTVQAKNGNVEVRVVRRSDHRWDGRTVSLRTP